MIVLIRTFLSFALEVDLHGRWPWNPETAITDHTDRVGDDAAPASSARVWLGRGRVRDVCVLPAACQDEAIAEPASWTQLRVAPASQSMFTLQEISLTMS